MSRGYRGFILALVGWLILAAAKPNASSYDGDTQKRIANAAEKIVAALEKPSSSPDYEKSCRNAGNYHDSDLCAQWTAANASVEAAEYTKYGFIAAVVAGVLAFIALFFSWRSAKAATDAVVDNRAGNRAFLKIRSCGIEIWPNGDLIMGANVENIGPTTAPEATIKCRIRLWVDNIERHVSTRTSHIHSDEVLPGQNWGSPNVRYPFVGSIYPRLDSLAGRYVKAEAVVIVSWINVFRVKESRVYCLHRECYRVEGLMLHLELSAPPSEWQHEQMRHANQSTPPAF